MDILQDYDILKDRFRQYTETLQEKAFISCNYDYGDNEGRDDDGDKMKMMMR